MGDNILVVGIEKDFGPNIAHAKILVDDSFLIERLKEKLQDIKSGSAAFNMEQAERVIGDRPIATTNVKVDQQHTEDDVLLNPEQRDAVARCQASEIIYIWGPPGTGKTTLLARMIETYYRCGFSILLVSNTNVAVDTALEQIAKKLRTDVGFQEGAVLRQGTIVKPELERDYGDKVELEKVVARLGANLHREKMNLESQRSGLEGEARSVQHTIGDWTRLDEEQATVGRLKHNLKAQQEKEGQQLSTISSLEVEGVSLKKKLARSQDVGSVRRFFLGLNPETIGNRLVSNETKLSTYKSALHEVVQVIAVTKSELEVSTEKLIHLKKITASHPSYKKCREKLSTIENRISSIQQKIDHINEQLEQLRNQVIKNCRILATTIYRAYLKGQVERSFDVVVIDEASMLALPMSFYGAGLANRHVVVTGDFRQLPPIIMSDDDLAEEWLKCDVFSKAGIVKALKSKKELPYLVTLRTQYRMSEDICDVINTLFYDDYPLETARDIGPNEDFPFGNSSLLYIDTAPYHPWSSLRVGTYSRYNMFHALLLRNMASRLSRCSYMETKNVNAGIISPYSAQTKLIQRMLDDIDTITKTSVIASTVHRFQGNEKDVIFFDLTDSLGTRLSKFVRSTDMEQDGARLLNVALSRAKRTIILIANFESLRRKLPPDSFVAKILAIFLAKGSPIDTKDILPFSPDEWKNGLNVLNPVVLDFAEKAAGMFTESQFYEAFERDILNAKESIVIFSPYITLNGTGRWMPILGQRISEGVTIRLVTRPPGDQGGILENGLAENIDDISKTGVSVDFRARMHEKFAVIDGTILWHGSLNIFSHRNTSESMIRLLSPSTCEQLAALVTSSYRTKDKTSGSRSPLVEKENPTCTNCCETMVWNNGKFGVYFECKKCGSKRDGRTSRSDLRYGSGVMLQTELDIS